MPYDAHLVEDLIREAKNVVACWSEGDLCEAVNRLREAAYELECESSGESIFDEEKPIDEN